MLSDELRPTRLIERIDGESIAIERRQLKTQFRVATIFLRILGLGLTIVGLQLTGRLSAQRFGSLLREFCQSNGVLWIKIGQLISMRPDLASETVRAELARLQDRVAGFPGEVAVQVMERELGQPIERYFDQFEQAPFAAASIAQVHRARLRREQIWVAIKVQRPDARSVCQRDLKFVRRLASLLVAIRFKPHARWRDMLWEIEEAMEEELDYRYEGSNIRRIRKTLRQHDIYVPKVFSLYSTSHVLVMEFVHGVLMSDYLAAARNDPQRLYAWLRENDVRPALVARRLLLSFLRQVFEDNLFHGDLHPGNIVLLRNSKIAFLDFGSLGTMERDFQRRVELFVESLATRQYAKAIDIFLMFSHDLPATDLVACKDQMIRSLQAWDARSRVPSIPFKDKSLNGAMDKLVIIGSRYSISTVWTFFRMTRALATMDSSLAALMPEANFFRLIDDYFHHRASRTRERMLESPLGETPNMRDLIMLQKQFMEDSVFRGSIVRRTAQVFESTTSKVALFFARLFGAAANILTLVSIFLFLLMLYQKAPGVRSYVDSVLAGGGPALTADRQFIPHGEFDFQVWLVVFLLLFYAIAKFRTLKHKFAQKT